MKKINFKDLIIFQDEDFCLINKPPWIATLHDRAADVNLQQLAEDYDPKLRAVHRIDKETSGILAYARSEEAFGLLARQFEHRKVEKAYHAIADGIHKWEDFVIQDRIEVLSTGIARVSGAGKAAETRVTTLKAFRFHTLLRCEPVTGRLHQIRVHLAKHGAPLTGDEKYGGYPLLISRLKKNFQLKQGTEEKPVIQRVALHAFSLGFYDLSDNIRTFEAPYPKDFSAAVRQLEKNS